MMGRGRGPLGWLIGRVGLFLAMSLAFIPGATDVHAAEEECFPLTGQCVHGRFLSYWREHAGLAINGYPLSGERSERLEDGRVYRVQYFERVRLEYHPENPAPGDVLLGQFGRRLHPAEPPAARQAGASYFAETGHNLGGEFLAYWQANGGLAQFGYPLGEEATETLDDGKPYTIQYFERARLELHPENPAPYRVLLGQFGRRILATLPPTITAENVGQLGEVGRWGKGWPTTMQYSPDGRWLVVVSAAGTTIFDNGTLVERQFFPLVWATTFSADGTRLMLALGEQGLLETRRVSDFTLLSTLPLQRGLASYLRVSPNSQWLAVARDQTIEIIRMSDGSTLSTFEAHWMGIWSLAFSSDSRTLVSSDEGYFNPERPVSFRVKRWRVPDGVLLAEASPTSDLHLGGTLSPDGSLVVSVGYFQITLWRFVDNSLIPISTLNRPSLDTYRTAVVFSPHGETILAGTKGGKFLLWDAQDGHLLDTLQTEDATSRFVALAPDGNVFASIATDAILRQFHRASGAVRNRSLSFKTGGLGIITPDGTMVVSGADGPDGRGQLRLSRLDNGEVVRTIQTDSGYIITYALSPDGQILASSGANLAIQLWRLADGSPIRTMTGQEWMASQISFSPDGQFLGAYDSSHKFYLWRLSDGQLLQTFPASPVSGSVVFSNDSQAIAFTTEQGIQLYSVADGALVGTLPSGRYGKLVLSPDNTILLVRLATSMQVWDWEAQQLLDEITFADRVNDLALYPDNTLLAVVLDNGALQFLRMSDRSVVGTVRDPSVRFSGVRWVPDGTTLAVSASDGTTRLWSLPGQSSQAAALSSSCSSCVLLP